MDISREINIYEKKGDTLLESISINNIELNQLINILGVNIKEDPYVYKIYGITNDKLIRLSEYIPELLKYNFEAFSFYYECYQM